MVKRARGIRNQHGNRFDKPNYIERSQPVNRQIRGLPIHRIGQYHEVMEKTCCFGDLISTRGGEVGSGFGRKRRKWIQLQYAKPFGVSH